MKIPKIVFQYSCIYDEMWKNKTNAKNYPTERKTRNYINKVEKLWKIYEGIKLI